MNKKILVFNEDGFEEKLKYLFLTHFQRKSTLSEIDFVYTGSIEDFEKNLLRGDWNVVIINFQTTFFIGGDYGLNELCTLNKKINTCMANERMKFAYASDGMKEYFSALGFLVLRKVTDMLSLREFLGSSPFKGNLVTLEEILAIVTERQKLPLDQVRTVRKRPFVNARQLAMYLSRKYTTKTLVQIGEYYGGRDHTTVIHSSNAVLDEMDINEIFRDEVNYLSEVIENRYGCTPCVVKRRS